MSGAAAISREHLWRRAEALSAEPAGPAPQRYRRGGAAPWSFQALVAAPEWLSWPQPRLHGLAQLAAAIAVSRAWRGGIDGEPLQRAAQAIGEPMLERVLELPVEGLPQLLAEPAACGDGQELARLGAALLTAAAPHPACAAGRLAPSLAAPPAPLDAAAARATVGVALTLLAEDAAA